MTGAATVRRGPWSVRPVWPVWAMVAGYPVWWFLGLTEVVAPVIALAMVWYLWRLRSWRTPPGFYWWAAFLVVVLASAVMIGVNAPGTANAGGWGPVGGYALRVVQYLTATVFLLYIGNRREDAVPISSVVRSISALAVATILLGLVAVAVPNWSMKTVGSYFLPEALTPNRIKLAQVQAIIGDLTPRPAAPFNYTNAWGTVLALAVVWLVVAGFFLNRSRRIKVLTGVVVLLGAIPLGYSLNRGVWIALVLAIGYVALRLAFLGRLFLAAVIVAGITLTGSVVALTPLGDVVVARFETGHSNQIRTGLANDAVRLANTSPLLGYGTTRSTSGSYDSIAIGPSADCPRCGDRVIGSTGHVWLLLVSQGYFGTILYYVFFGWTLWRYRRDNSVIGIAASTVLLLSVFFGFFYSALQIPLLIAMASVGLLWRGAQLRHHTYDKVTLPA